MNIGTRRKGFLHRIVLVHCWAWLDQHVKDKNVDMPTLCYKLKSAGYACKAINGFDDNEAEVLKAIALDKEFEPIKKKEISLVVMALEVMKEHVTKMPKEFRKPIVNISDSKLKAGKGVYAMHMLKAKKIKPELYEEQKEVILDTEQHAKIWYKWMKDAILSGKFEKEKK